MTSWALDTRFSFFLFLWCFLGITPVFQISPGDGGAIQTVFQVEPDELLVAVMQDEGPVSVGQNSHLNI